MVPVMDPAISCFNKTLTVHVEGVLVFKKAVAKRLEDLLKTLFSLLGLQCSPLLPPCLSFRTWPEILHPFIQYNIPFISLLLYITLQTNYQTLSSKENMSFQHICIGFFGLSDDMWSFTTVLGIQCFRLLSGSVHTRTRRGNLHSLRVSQTEFKTDCSCDLQHVSMLT